MQALAASKRKTVNSLYQLEEVPGDTKDFTVVSRMDEEQLLDVDYGNGLVIIAANDEGGGHKRRNKQKVQGQDLLQESKV